MDAPMGEVFKIVSCFFKKVKKTLNAGEKRSGEFVLGEKRCDGFLRKWDSVTFIVFFLWH